MEKILTQYNIGQPSRTRLLLASIESVRSSYSTFTRLFSRYRYLKDAGWKDCLENSFSKIVRLAFEGPNFTCVGETLCKLTRKCFLWYQVLGQTSRAGWVNKSWWYLSCTAALIINDVIDTFNEIESWTYLESAKRDPQPPISDFL